jgi:hypothetical protein
VTRGMARGRCQPFRLDSPGDGAGDGLDAMADEVTSELGGLTIVSAAGDASWLGVEGPVSWPPPAAPSQARPTARSVSGTLSVASSMTEPPSLRSVIPAGGSGGGRGGGSGGADWRPSTDIHALRNANGELRPTQMFYVGCEKKICFGMIGTRRFCRSETCKTKAHKSNKFAMGCKGGWFLLAGKSNQVGQPNAFVRPFLDDSKITEDTLMTLRSGEQRTTAKWEEFILEAQDEWEEVQLRTLDNIQEDLGDDKQDDNKDDSIMWEGDLLMRSHPSDWCPPGDLDNQRIILKKEVEDGRPKDTMEAIKELQVAFGDLEGMVVEARRGSCNDTLDMMAHVGSSVTEIVSAIDRINRRGWQWVRQIGDVEVLQEDMGRHDITLVDAVTKVLAVGSSSAESSAEVQELSQVVEEVDNDLAKACTFLNNKIKALERKQAMLAAAPSSVSALSLSTLINDAHGDFLTTLGDMLRENESLKRENSLLTQRVDGLAAGITAQGGIVLWKHTFTSEYQLLQLCLKECPKGDAFAAFVDPMVIFCFDPSYTSLSGWETLTKAMEKSGNYPVTDRKVVASYNAHHSHWFAEGKMVVAGKTLPAFASKEKWQGTGGMDGRRVEIKLSLDASADGVRTGIKDKLPAGSQLGQLALRMLEHTLAWFSTVFKHLDAKFVHLTQVNISEEETLILLSEEVIIMYDRFHVIRQKRMDFMVNRLQVEYLARCIWITMQVHMVMDEFTQNGMKYNSSILAAFMHFLTKVTGGIAAAGVAVS